MNPCKIFCRLLLAVMINPIMFALATVDEKRDAYREIQKIQDPDDRIVSELSLSVLGLPREAPTNRMKSMEALQALANDSPDQEYNFDIILSRGLSANDVADIIDTGRFTSVTRLQLKYPEGDLLRTIGFGSFDEYNGPTSKIVEFLLYEHREILRAQIEAFRPYGVDTTTDEALLAKMEDIPKLRFYIISGRMKARHAESLRRSHGSVLMDIGLSKNLPQSTISNSFVLPTKKPLPNFDLKERPSISIEQKSFMMKNVENKSPTLLNSFFNRSQNYLALTESLVDFILASFAPRAYSSESVSCSGSTGDLCPPDSMWLPSETHPEGAHFWVCVFSSCASRTVVSLFSEFKSDQELWSWQNISLPFCVPNHTGSVARCSAPNTAYVIGGGFEHQLDSHDTACSLGLRTGLSSDKYFNCLWSNDFDTNLPGLTYLGSTALDPGDQWVAEVGTHNGSQMAANVEYRSNIRAKSGSHLSIQDGNIARMANSIMFIRNWYPDGLDEFIIDQTEDPSIYVWTSFTD